MTTIIVLFNLRAGVSPADYEKFAREQDIPEVNRLPSVERFEVLRSEGLMSGGKAPYQYIEILRCDTARLGTDTQSPLMKKIVATFRSMADDPTFIITSPLTP